METLRFSTVNPATVKLFDRRDQPAKAGEISQRIVAASVDNWGSSYASKASTALGNIFSILSAKAQHTDYAPSGQERLPADVAHYMANNDGTTDDALALMKQTIAERDWTHGTDMQRSLAKAVEDNSATVTNFSDLGVTTSTEHMLQFDTDGRLVGSAQWRDAHEATDLLQRNFTFAEGKDALGFDRLTGQKATYVMTGNEYFYIRWQ